MEFPEKLTRLMEERGRKGKDLAEFAVVGPPTVSKWKSGETEPDLGQALLIARFFDVPLEWLADDSAGDLPHPGESNLIRDCLKVIERIGPQAAYDRLVGAASPPLIEAKATVAEVPKRSANRPRNSGA